MANNDSRTTEEVVQSIIAKCSQIQAQNEVFNLLSGVLDALIRHQLNPTHPKLQHLAVVLRELRDSNRELWANPGESNFPWMVDAVLEELS